MFVAFCLCLPLGLLVCSVWFVSALCAVEEPTGDLTPLLPAARSLFNSNDGNLWQFRNFNSNGGTPSLSADGRWLLTTGNGLMLWDLNEAPQPQGQRQPRTFHLGPVNLWNAANGLSPDGKTAAVVPMHFGNDMAVRFFDTATGRQIREIDNDQQIFGLAFSPDGRLLAVRTQQNIEVWKADNGEEVRVFSAGANNMPNTSRRLSFSPDGKMLATLGNEPDTVHIWEIASGKERASVPFGSQPAPQPVGRRAARLRAFVPGNNPNTTPILALAFSADSRLLAVSKQDSAIYLWDIHANRPLPPLTGARGHVIALVFSADGKELIAVDTEGTRLSWRLSSLRRNNHIRLAPLDDADFAELWDDLAAPDVFRVYRARRHLIADPKRAVPLLSSHLKPVPAGDKARLEQLVKDLSSANAGTRRKAMTELRTKHGEAALGALLQQTGGGNAANGGMPPGVIVNGMGGNNQAAMLLLQKLQAQYKTPERQRDVLAVHVLEEIGTPEARQTLAKLAKGAPGVELTSASKAALDHVAAAVKEQPRQAAPEQLWTDLGSDDAARAFQTLCRLVAAPDRAVALLRKELKPVAVIEEREIVALLDDLNSDDFKVREHASKALADISEQALPAMKKALEGDIALEARKRLERLVEQAASRTSAPLLRALRAIEVLEHLGTAESKHVLLDLAGGAPQAQVTREAKASLQRLARR